MLPTSVGQVVGVTLCRAVRGQAVHGGVPARVGGRSQDGPCAVVPGGGGGHGRHRKCDMALVSQRTVISAAARMPVARHCHVLPRWRVSDTPWCRRTPSEAPPLPQPSAAADTEHLIDVGLCATTMQLRSVIMAGGAALACVCAPARPHTSVRERTRARARAHTHQRATSRVCAHVCACARMCVCVCVYAHASAGVRARA